MAWESFLWPLILEAETELLIGSQAIYPVVSPLPSSLASEGVSRWVNQTGNAHGPTRAKSTPNGQVEDTLLETDGEVLVEFRSKPAIPKAATTNRLGWLLDDWVGSSTEPALLSASGASVLPDQPVRLVMAGEATITSSTTQAAVGTLLSRNTLRGTELTLNFVEETLTSAHPGLLLLEDYVAGAPSQPASGDPFARVVGQDKSQTLLSWGGSMRFDRPHRRAEFIGQVELAHVAGDQLLGFGRSPETNAAPPPNTDKSGRRVSMRAGKMTVEFSSLAAGTAALASGDRGPLSAFVAEGGVWLDYGVYQVSADVIGYYSHEQLLKIAGTDGADAVIYTPESVTKNPGFEIDLKTQQLSRTGRASILLYPK
jgi:hypothetical protein